MRFVHFPFPKLRNLSDFGGISRMAKFEFAPKAFEHIFHKRLIFNLFHIFYFIFDVRFVNIPRSYPALHVLRKTTLWNIIAVLRQELHLSAMRSDTVADYFRLWDHRVVEKKRTEVSWGIWPPKAKGCPSTISASLLFAKPSSLTPPEYVCHSGIHSDLRTSVFFNISSVFFIIARLFNISPHSF